MQMKLRVQHPDTSASSTHNPDIFETAYFVPRIRVDRALNHFTERFQRCGFGGRIHESASLGFGELIYISAPLRNRTPEK